MSITKIHHATILTSRKMVSFGIGKTAGCLKQIKSEGLKLQHKIDLFKVSFGKDVHQMSECS